MDMKLLTEAAHECMSPDQMNAFEALFANADLARRYANCVRKRIALPEAAAGPTAEKILDLIYECNLGGATEQQALEFASRLLNF